MGFLRATFSTFKAVVVPVADTISDCVLIVHYWRQAEKRWAALMLGVIFLFSHAACCGVIFYRLCVCREATATWNRGWKKLLMALLTLFTLGPVVLKLFEIFGTRDREEGARRPTCYSKLVLCTFECIPQFLINVFIVCSDGFIGIEQAVSLVLSLLAAAYSVQRYTNPTNEKCSRPAQNFIHSVWISLTLLGCVLPVALVAAKAHTLLLLCALLPLYVQPYMLFYRNITLFTHTCVPARKCVDNAGRIQDNGSLMQPARVPSSERCQDPNQADQCPRTHNPGWLGLRCYFVSGGNPNRRYRRLFLVVAGTSLAMEAGFVVWYAVQLSYQGIARNAGHHLPTNMYLDEQRPLVIVSSSVLLLLAYSFFFPVIVVQWAETQAFVCRLLEWALPMSGYETRVSMSHTLMVHLPTLERSELLAAMCRAEPTSHAAYPTFKRMSRRTVSLLTEEDYSAAEAASKTLQSLPDTGDEEEPQSETKADVPPASGYPFKVT